MENLAKENVEKITNYGINFDVNEINKYHIDISDESYELFYIQKDNEYLNVIDINNILYSIISLLKKKQVIEEDSKVVFESLTKLMHEFMTKYNT